MRELTNKQQRFVEEYLVDCNATQAAIRAGYSVKTADQIAAQLVVKTHVKEAIAAKQEKLAKRTETTAARVIECLWANHDRAVLEGVREGGSVANKALELIGKHVGAFADRLQVSGPNGEPMESKMVIEFVAAKKVEK